MKTKTCWSVLNFTYFFYPIDVEKLTRVWAKCNRFLMGSSRKPFTHSLCEKIIALGLKIKIVQDFAEKRNLKGNSNAISLKWKWTFEWNFTENWVENFKRGNLNIQNIFQYHHHKRACLWKKNQFKYWNFQKLH